MNKNSWEDRAACAPENRTEETKDLDWFSNDSDEKYRARAVCQNSCPVRKECVQFALENRMLHGIWGGVDDYEIRRAMSVDAVGDPLERNRVPRCPYCMSRKLDIAGQRVNKKGYLTKCLNPECGLTWWMLVIPRRMRKAKNVA